MTTYAVSFTEVQAKIDSLFEKGLSADDVLGELSRDELVEFAREPMRQAETRFKRYKLDQTASSVKLIRPSSVAPTDSGKAKDRALVRDLEHRALIQIEEAASRHADGKAKPEEVSAIFFDVFRPNGVYVEFDRHDGRRVAWLLAEIDDFESRKKLLNSKRAGIERSIAVVNMAETLVASHKSVAKNLLEVENHFREHGADANDVRLMEQFLQEEEVLTDAA